MLQLAPATWLLWRNALATADTGFVPAKIRLDLAPDQSTYNPADERLRDAAGKLQLALNAEDVKVGLFFEHAEACLLHMQALIQNTHLWTVCW